MSIVNVLTWLAFEADDVKRNMVVLESSSPSEPTIGVDWLITAKLLFNIDAECPSDIVVFLLCCERLKVKVLGTIKDVRELLTGLEVVGSIEVPTDVSCTMGDCETKLAFSDNELDGNEYVDEVTFDSIDDRVGITDANALLLDIDEADNSNEVTFRPMLLKVLLPWVDVTTVKFRATKLAVLETFLASDTEIRIEALLAETDCLEM